MNKLLITSVALIAVLTLNAQAATVVVDSTANIFGAGHSTPPAPGGGSAGTLPPSFTFSPGSYQILAFSSVSGDVRLTPEAEPPSPDGYFLVAPSDISSFGGISGIRHDLAGFLVGVFLGPAETVDPAPPILDFRASALGTSFDMLSPEIGQTFFIGDGLTGTGSGSVQQFMVPATATRLFLGLADAYDYTGAPGQYQDNSGSFSATFTIVPSPIIIATQRVVAAITKKTLALEKIDAALADEQPAYDALEAVLAGGDLGGLKYGDVVQAKQDIHSAMQHQIQAKDALEKSIDKLKTALAELGVDAAEIEALHTSAVPTGPTENASAQPKVVGDIDGDGDVDIVDLGLLAGNYGHGTSAPQSFAADSASLKANAESAPTDEQAKLSDLGNCITPGILLIGGIGLAFALLRFSAYKR